MSAAILVLTAIAEVVLLTIAARNKPQHKRARRRT